MRHRFHSLCSYFAMFPESFAEHWLARLTKPGDMVLDPFCGRGTLPFQALLMDRRAIGCDVNPVAYCVSRAKTCAPSSTALRRRLTMLERAFNGAAYEEERRKLPEFFSHAYRPATLRQILYLRSSLRFRESDTDCMLAALVLGSLHGESARSPSFLSNQMPHTISTKPAYSVRFWKQRHLRAPDRDAFALLRRMIEFRYQTPAPRRRAVIIEGDMRSLPTSAQKFTDKVRCVVTSPPYFDVTDFEEDQWLRLWFLGGPPYPTSGRVSSDDRHERRDGYWRLIADAWRMLGAVVAAKAHVVFRIGAVRISPRQLVDGLEATSSLSGRRVRLVEHQTSELVRRQTDSFRPGSKGCRVEVDCHFLVN